MKLSYNVLYKADLAEKRILFSLYLFLYGYIPLSPVAALHFFIYPDHIFEG